MLSSAGGTRPTRKSNAAELRMRRTEPKGDVSGWDPPYAKIKREPKV
jgi:hypothetical protein